MMPDPLLSALWREFPQRRTAYALAECRPIRTADQIVASVAAKHRTGIKSLRSYSRLREVQTARWEAAYELRAGLGLTFPAIARELGYRDHTAALHAVAMFGTMNGLPPLSRYARARKRHLAAAGVA